MKERPLRHGCTMPGRLLLALPLALLLACGGGSHPSPPPRAARIVYTPPTSGTYQLLLNTEKSTATHLVLDLMGPTGTAGRGVAFHLVAPPGQMTWAKVDSKDAELTQSPTFGVVAGSVLKAKATSGDLQVGAFLTWAFTPSVTFDRTVSLATVALDLVPETAPGAATLRSTSGSAVMLPATLGADPVPITITAGTVTLQ